MLSRFIVKRNCHSHGRTKCYESIYKIDSLRSDVNEIKEIIKDCEKPLMIIYTSSIISSATAVLFFIKSFL
jgi:hypothetical protein